MSEPIALRIEQIRARVQAATPGPWTYVEPGHATEVDPQSRESYVRGPAYLPLPDTVAMEPHDARFVANARLDVPWLLDRIADLESVIGDDPLELKLARVATEYREMERALGAARAEVERLRGHLEHYAAKENWVRPLSFSEHAWYRWGGRGDSAVYKEPWEIARAALAGTEALDSDERTLAALGPRESWADEPRQRPGLGKTRGDTEAPPDAQREEGT